MRTIHEIGQIEEEVSKKYGEDARELLKDSWDEEKEKNYIDDLKKIKTYYKNSNSIIKSDGICVAKKLLEKKSQKKCKFCNKLIYSIDDLTYLESYESCFKCYVQHIEGR